MKIIFCSGGHQFDIDTIKGRWDSNDRWTGSKRCPVCLSYDRMQGHEYCGRRLKELEAEVERLFERMFKKRYSPNDSLFSNDKWEYITPIESTEKETIRSLLLSSESVRTGFIPIFGRPVGVVFFKKK